MAPDSIPTKVLEVCRTALTKTSPAERAAFLDAACASDATFRQQVEAALRAHDDPSRFPAGAELAATANLKGEKVRCGPAGVGSDSGTANLKAAGAQSDPSVEAAPNQTAASGEEMGTRIGPYLVLKPIGEGGMGTVYQAEQQEPVRRMVALKVIKAGMDSAQVIARFEQERQALALMDHPNIARVFDAGANADGRPYFVMELVKGVSITTFCDAHKMTFRERLELFIPVCQAVQHAHQKGVIHRDLKPSNVLVARFDDRPTPKIIDFGVAKATNRSTDRTQFTEFGVIVGTFAYMSPEQVLTKTLDIDTRSDIYSLGVMLYELLTGSLPIDPQWIKQAELDEVLRRIRDEEPPKPSTRLSQSGDDLPVIAARRRTEPAQLGKVLRGDLDWIVLKAMEKDRRRRYETVNGLVRDIERFLADEPVEARPPSAGYRLRKFAHKHRTALATAAAFVVLLVGGLLVSAWLAVRATQAEAYATVQRDAAVVNEQRARENEEAAKQERDKARAAREELRRIFYASQMNLAQNAWETNNIERLLALLAPPSLEPGEADLRGFEWHYWRRLCHAELQTRTLPARDKFFFSADASRVAGIGSKDGKRCVQVWEAATGAEVAALAEDPAFLALAPDGKQIATIKVRGQPGGEEGDLEVWDVATGRRTFHVPLPSWRWSLMGAIDTLMSFDREGKRLALIGRVGKPGILKVWDLPAEKEVFSRKADKGWMLRPLFSPDGKRLAAVVETGKNVGRVQVWDLASGKEVFSLLSPLKKCLAFSPDGKRLVTGEWIEEGNVKVWDAANGQLLLSLTEPSGRPAGLHFNAKGDRLAVNGYGRMATVWDLAANGRQALSVAWKWPAGNSREACALAFSADGERLLTADVGGVLREWHAEPRDGVFRLEKRHGNVDTASLTFRRLLSADGALLATTVPAGEKNRQLRIWDAAAKEKGRVPFFIPAEGESVFDLVTFSPDGRFLTTAVPGADDAHGLAVWEIATAKQAWTLPGGRGYAGAVFSGDGNRLVASLANPPGVCIWEASSGKELGVLPASGAPRRLAASFDGRHIGIVQHADREGDLAFELKMADVAAGLDKATWRTLATSAWKIDQIAVSPDGQQIAATFGGASAPGPWGMSTHMEVKVWDAATGKERFALKTPTGYLFQGLAYSPDGKRLATAENDLNGAAHVVKLWDVATGQEVLTLKAMERVTKLAFSADGHRLHGLLLYPGPRGELVQVWDATPGR